MSGRPWARPIASLAMNAKDLQTRLDAALEACWRAGKITLEYYQAHPLTEIKSDGSPVTIADKRAEQEIRRWLTKYFPQDAIVGEEEGAGPKSEAGTWYIDPIDGTRSFVCGVPFYGVLLAYEIHQEVALGVINFPALEEMVWALRGHGCFWNGRRAHVSTVTELPQATLLATDFFAMDRLGHTAAREHLCAKTKLQRTWGDAYGHFLVATGRAEIMLDARMSVWDCGPLLPIIEEAGGRFTDWQGQATIHGDNAFSTNGHLHQAVRQILAGEAGDHPAVT